MKLTVCFFFVLSCLTYSSFSQEYSYTHYDIADGLAGSVVYCITQDKDGFIWAGTETGVSRFDGTHFKNFTAADGLPDIEVLRMFGDSKGRVWMAPFRKSVCYYYKGKIYNQENDSLLHRIRLKNNIENFAEDAAGNILVQEMTELHLISPDGAVREIDSIGSEPIGGSVAVSASASGHFLVQSGEKVFAFSDKGFTPVCSFPFVAMLPIYIAMSRTGMIWRVNMTSAAFRSFTTGKTLPLRFEWKHYKHLSFSSVDDSLFYLNELTGATEINVHTGATRLFLPGREVSRTFRDVTGNMWFATMGQGIFRLNSDEFRTIRLKADGQKALPVYAINKIGNRLLVGDGRDNILTYLLRDMSFQRSKSLATSAKNQILFIYQKKNGNIVCGSSSLGITESDADFNLLRVAFGGIKSAFKKDSAELILGTFWGVALFDLNDFRMKDTLWRERSTAVYYRNDTTYVGTLNGLYAIARDKSVVFLGKEFPFLQKRISSLAESAGGVLWVASYDGGIIGYRNGQVVATFTKKQGLTSDICRTLLVHNNILWVGTDKGLNKIDLGQPGYPVTQYTANDGLGSDIINTLFADSSMIYVGTSAGLSFFDEAKANIGEGCRLYLLSLLNAGKERIGDSAHLLLSYRDKDFRLEFAGISYRSVGSISYYYRLLGLDSAWRQTKETFLEYPTLPSGQFEFQLEAINKFGDKSRLLSLRLEVETPFWQSTWFYALIIAAFLSLTWVLVAFRIKGIRRRQEEKERLTQRMVEMEHTALQAQMNPHFIFNCLNSIQQYVFDQDVYSANKYIAGFARLIRATLYNSSRSFISLSDEISYLSTYLSLEKLRFKEAMVYTIDVDDSINRDSYILPPMLIQPYIENSMRHGLRHKKDSGGYIHLQFREGGGGLMVTIEDNGIGRKKAASFKTREHIEYQSKGMALTADRIRMMNATYKDTIHVEVIDLEDKDGGAAGTRVVMQFPLYHETI
jgi:ligand-binding sensor domain-containing protein